MHVKPSLRGIYGLSPSLLTKAGLKKDPGIPNLFPLKEQLLKQMEEKKQATQAQREKERQLRAQEKKRRKQSLQGMQNDAQRRTKEFEKKVLAPWF